MSKFVTLHGFGGGNSGTELNFEVVGGTSQPTNPTENMIWINTSTTISDYIFSATQPTAVSGRVWISIGTSSPAEFNALKDSGIQVYPISAKQYVSGTWVDVTAKSYQNGKWVEWFTFLLNLFDRFTEARENGSGSVTVENGVIKCITQYGREGHVMYGSNKQINLSEYKTLTFKATVSSNAYVARVGFYARNTDAYYWSNSAVTHISLEKGKTKEYSIDLSSIDSNAYFGIYLACGQTDTAVVNIDVMDVYLWK